MSEIGEVYKALKAIDNEARAEIRDEAAQQLSLIHI